MSAAALLSLFSLAIAVHADIVPADNPDAVHPGLYHVYLQFLPKADEQPEAELTRIETYRVKIRALLPKNSPEMEKSALGQKTVRWTVSGWDAPAVSAKRAQARALLGEDPSVRLRVVPAPPARQDSVPTPEETAQLLESRTGAVKAYFQKDFGRGFPDELLTWKGGNVFDNAENSARAEGVPVTVLLFDKDPSPDTDSENRIALARSKPRVPLLSARTAPPPPPLQYDSVVAEVAREQGLEPDVLRSLIYASKGYEGGYPKRSGLYGPMGLSRASAQWVGIAADDVANPQANIRGGAELFKKLSRMFGGDISRTVAAFYCGAGTVQQSQGIPKDCTEYLGRFQLAYRNGAGWALAPGTQPKRPAPPPIVPEREVKPVEAVGRQVRETVVGAVQGVPPTGRREHFQNVPAKLVAAIKHEATTGSIQMDPNVIIALAEAEGGVNAGTSSAGARGVLQLTWATAKWECGFTQRSQLADMRKNIDCSERVLKRRLDKANGDIVLAWALYNTKEKWHKIMIDEGRVANIRETVRHVTRASYRYYQLTGKWLLDPESAEFAKYFNSQRSRQWSNEALADVQRWDRNEMGIAHPARTVPRSHWRLNSTRTHCYRRDPSGRKTWELNRVPPEGCSALAV